MEKFNYLNKENYLSSWISTYTHFFRIQEDKKIDSIIKKYINKDDINIWSAACSTGQEPYSLSITAKEVNKKVFILASDLSDENIKKAKNGIYSKNEVISVNPNFLKKYFDHRNENWKVKEKVKENILFRKIDLLNDKDISSIKKQFDLIFICAMLDFYQLDLIEIIIKNAISKLKNNGCIISPTLPNLFSKMNSIYNKLGLLQFGVGNVHYKNDDFTNSLFEPKRLKKFKYL